jgi:hypothetical protein
LEVFFLVDVNPNDQRVRAPLFTGPHILLAAEVVLVMEKAGVEQRHLLPSKRPPMQCLCPPDGFTN